MPGQTQALRIIAGEYRGRRLDFKPAPGLRPTGDRARETLFNWLQPVIAGAHCLDMFAGSGLLGMEAISRGAADVVFIEQHKATAQQLQNNIDKLDVRNAHVVCGNAFERLADLDKALDVIFIDPPFKQDMLIKACQQLHASNLIKPSSSIYLESERQVKADDLPTDWQVIREKQAGQVFYYLVKIN